MELMIYSESTQRETIFMKFPFGSFNRVFAVGDKKKKLSIYVHEPILEGLESLRMRGPDKLNEVIVAALDEYLTAAAKEKMIPFPTNFNPSETED